MGIKKGTSSENIISTTILDTLTMILKNILSIALTPFPVRFLQHSVNIVRNLGRSALWTFRNACQDVRIRWAEEFFKQDKACIHGSIPLRICISHFYI